MLPPSWNAELVTLILASPAAIAVTIASNIAAALPIIAFRIVDLRLKSR
jgi:hypothetical protein